MTHPICNLMEFVIRVFFLICICLYTKKKALDKIIKKEFLLVINVKKL